MIIKIVLALLLTVAVGLLGLSEIGFGVFKFLPQSEAQAVIEEGNSVEEAIDLYALENDGQVLTGDPNLCEDDPTYQTTVEQGDCAPEDGQKTLHYIRESKLLKNYVGKAFDDINDPWRLNETTKTLERVVSGVESCREINNIRLGTPLTEPVPTCGTPEGDNSFCCVSNS
jgi:hypothetical protein